MHKLLMRVTLTVFITTGAVLLALIVVVNHEIAENFTSYLNMSGMHGMMQHGMTKLPSKTVSNIPPGTKRAGQVRTGPARRRCKRKGPDVCSSVPGRSPRARRGPRPGRNIKLDR